MVWFDFIILGVLVFSFIKGYKSGLVMQLAMLVGLIVSAIFAGKLSELVTPYLIRWIDGIPSYVLSPISYLIAFVLIISACFFWGKIFESLLKLVLLGFVNSFIGGLFSMLKWLVIFSILLNLILMLDYNHKLIDENTKEKSLTFEPVSQIAQTLVPFLRPEDSKSN